MEPQPYALLIVLVEVAQLRDEYRPFSNVLTTQVVVSILDTANSSYLAPFNVLSQRIKEGSVEANNNLKFLESITTPCQNVRASRCSLLSSQSMAEAAATSSKGPVEALTKG